MAPIQLVFTVVFMLGLVLVFVVMPWKTLYQRRIQHGLPLLDQWSFAPSRLDLFDMLFTLVIYFGVQVIGITVVVKTLIQMIFPVNSSSYHPLILPPVSARYSPSSLWYLLFILDAAIFAQCD
jgi:hypothetical protein